MLILLKDYCGIVYYFAVYSGNFKTLMVKPIILIIWIFMQVFLWFPMEKDYVGDNN